MTASLSSLFGLLALTLASVGLYGVMAHTVARRTSEIGLRMALGTLQGQILAMVMREALAAGRRRSRDRYPGRGIRRCFASIGKTGTGSIAVRLMSGFGDDFAQMRPIEPNRGRS